MRASENSESEIFPERSRSNRSNSVRHAARKAQSPLSKHQIHTEDYLKRSLPEFVKSYGAIAIRIEHANHHLDCVRVEAGVVSIYQCVA